MTARLDPQDQRDLLVLLAHQSRVPPDRRESWGRPVLESEPPVPRENQVPLVHPELVQQDLQVLEELDLPDPLDRQAPRDPQERHSQ